MRTRCVLIVAIIVVTTVGAGLAEVLRQCQEMGPGVHQIGGVSVDCTAILNR